MSYPDLELKVEKLRSDVCKIKERLYKLEDVRDEKEQVSADPSKLESNKDYALDWYINQYQNMCKEYNKVKIELDGKQSALEMYIDQNHKFFDQIKELEKKLDDKQKVLEMVMDQRDRLNKENIKFYDTVFNLEATNQRLKGTIKNHEDRILELEKEVEYHKAFAGSEKIKKLELDIKYLEDKNRFISDLNDAYRKMVVKEDE